MYVQNIDSLYTTVKEYRHDFINHIFALSGLARIKKYDEMESYLHTLSQVSGVLKEIIDIPIPAFNGLIQAKAAQALERDIHFNYDFKGFEQLNLEMMKITDLVRIAGNLLDNAFYAVQECDKGERTVSITAKVEQRTLTLRVMNNGDPISNELCERIFEQGFTTKPRTKNSGLGLSIVKKIIEEYNGHIQVESHEELTSFQIDIPLSQKEILLGIA
nr:ATP-binding protein [Paenibacillus shirakamiensis]